MIRLGDFVEALLNEMAIARTNSTLFGVEMAADFRDHELLRDLPIPVYRIGGAEVSLAFAVADVAANGRAPGALPLEPADVAEAARHVSERLPEEEAVKEAFALHDEQIEQWRRDVAPEIAERLAADAVKAPSIDAMSAIYGYLAKSQYLLSLVREREEASGDRLQQSVEAGYPDLVEASARRLLNTELQRLSRARAGDYGEARVEGGKGRVGRPRPKEIDSAVYVHVEADELAKRAGVSMLKLELEEGTVDELTFAEGEESDLE